MAERKRLAQELKAAGRRDEAKAVEKLPRPTVAVWTVNQLARREPKALEQFFRLTGELREIHERMLGGSEAGGDYAATAKKHREALKVLRDRAEAILSEAGQSSSPQLIQRVLATLRAGAAGDADAKKRIAEGRLERELGEAGFESLLEQAVAAGPPKARAAPPRPERAPARPAAPDRREGAERRRQEEAERRRKQALAREAERERSRARAVAQRKIAKLETATAAARKTLEKEEKARAAAREALAKAERRLEHARHEAELRARELLAAQEDLERSNRSPSAPR